MSESVEVPPQAVSEHAAAELRVPSGLRTFAGRPNARSHTSSSPTSLYSCARPSIVTRSAGQRDVSAKALPLRRWQLRQ